MSISVMSNIRIKMRPKYSQRLYRAVKKHLPLAIEELGPQTRKMLRLRYGLDSGLPSRALSYREVWTLNKRAK